MKNYQKQRATKKHIIWSNFNLDLKDWQDFLEENDLLEYDECRQYEEVANYNHECLDDERDNLSFIEGEVVAIADLGLWFGRELGYKIFKSVKDIFYTEGDYAEWYIDGSGVHGKVAHHDGTNHYKYYLVKDNVDIGVLDDALYDSVIYGKRRLENVLKQYTRSLRKEVNKVYGW